MKKYLFLLVCMLSTFMSVQAQQVTVWYGIGYKTQIHPIPILSPTH